MKKVFRFLVTLIAVPVVLFTLFLLYVTLADYKPEPVTVLKEAHGEAINVYDTLKVFNWNIGYCGLGDDMSFFYDGGDQVRTTKERTIENLNEVSKIILSFAYTDIFLFQEVDRSSRRSYKINQYDSIAQLLQNHNGSFALNYKVAFVPVPPNNPLGKVDGGLASFAKYEPFKLERYSFPGNYSWPKGLFLLDRCFLVQRFYTSNGKELLVINTHNSAYDDGSLRKKQMEVMKNFLIEEYSKGNYIVVGGDWNQNPPSVGNGEIMKEGRLTRMGIANNFMPDGWRWHYCDSIPTNRMINEVYSSETTRTTTIDFYLVSPNVMVTEQKNIDFNFKNSDHQPVLLHFTFVR